jgi:hypothetical protein
MRTLQGFALANHCFCKSTQSVYSCIPTPERGNDKRINNGKTAVGYALRTIFKVFSVNQIPKGTRCVPYWASRAKSVGRFRAANRHFKKAINIVAHYGFKAPFVGGLLRQIHPTIHPPYGHTIYPPHGHWRP